MVIDVFPFFNEIEILQIRLHELDRYVDKFIIVESTVTFSGQPKRLLFAENSHLFQPFLHKITHVVAPPTKRNPDNVWAIQAYQRDCASEMLLNCNDTNLIMIGDVDEIPRGQDFNEIYFGNESHSRTWLQKHYIYYTNLVRPGAWVGTTIMPYKILRDGYGGSLFKARMQRRKGKLIRPKNGIPVGWHFRNMGGQEAVELKLKSSGHFSGVRAELLLKNPDILHDRMEVKREDKGRKLVVESIEHHPQWFKDNIEDFKHLMTEEV